MALWPFGMAVPFPTNEDLRTALLCILNQLFKLLEPRISDHGTAIDLRAGACLSSNRLERLMDDGLLLRTRPRMWAVWPGESSVIKEASALESLDARLDEVDKLVDDLVTDDEALNADAVLADGLEAASHESRVEILQAGVVQDDRRVFPAELESDGRQLLRGSHSDFPSDVLASDEGDVRNVRVRRQGLCMLREASDQLNEVCIEFARQETRFDTHDKVSARPGDELGGLDDDGVTGEQAAKDRSEHIVCRVVPADAGADYAERLVNHLASLVRKQEIRRTSLSGQNALAVVAKPGGLGASGEQFSKGRIDGLTAMPRRISADIQGKDV